jgi:transglutaminase-like putative cysteine protease
MNRHRLLHVTEFEYDGPVSESYDEVHLQPIDDEFQTCVGFRLRTQPASAPAAARDYFGNWVHHFNVMPKHRRLRIEAESVVMTQEPPLDLHASETLAAVDRQRAALLDAYYDFLVPSPAVPAVDDIRALVRAAEDASGGTAAGFARAGAAVIHGHFRYTKGATQVHSSVCDVLTAGAGVCQDFAHLIIALARTRGLPARYVSGYLTPPETGQGTNGVEQVIGGRASHAWAELFVPGTGWVGVDPTLGALASGRHIRVAYGRDYSDVPPVRGVYRGQAGQRMSVNVLMRPAVDDDGCEHLRETPEPVASDPSPDARPQQQFQQQQ